ncbi:hypothetical protein PM082_023901 [Marasmius tenuissimus]|nr:hypothetical protein PM082_023901 [Marasmius tenuissimus]
MNHHHNLRPSLFAQDISQWTEYPFFVAKRALVTPVVTNFCLILLGITIGLFLTTIALCWWIKSLALEGLRLVCQLYSTQYPLLVMLDPPLLMLRITILIGLVSLTPFDGIM